MVKILIVDDTKSVHAFVKSLLARSSMIQTTSVYNGTQAIDLLNVNRKFDIILLDWEMPIMTGPQAFDEFTKMGLKIPTVMMTTKNSVEDISKMLEKGAAEYLLKPFTIDILFEKLERASGKVLSYAA